MFKNRKYIFLNKIKTFTAVWRCIVQNGVVVLCAIFVGGGYSFPSNGYITKDRHFR